MGSIPSLGRAHRATKPVHHKYWACVLETTGCGHCSPSPTRGAPAMRSLSATREEPCSPKLEKACSHGDAAQPKHQENSPEPAAGRQGQEPQGLSLASIKASPRPQHAVAPDEGLTRRPEGATGRLWGRTPQAEPVPTSWGRGMTAWSEQPRASVAGAGRGGGHRRVRVGLDG